MTPDGRLVAASIRQPDGRTGVFAWEAASGRLVFQVHGGSQTLAFAPDGSVLAGGTEASDIHIWSFNGGSEIHKLSTGQARPLASSSDRALVAISCTMMGQLSPGGAGG